MRGGMRPELLASINPVTEPIIAAAIKVHRALGPGLLESAYIACMAYELKHAGLQLASEVMVPIVYQGVRLDCGYRLDFVVNDLVIVEVKSVTLLASIHQAQVLTYLKLTGYPAALLINFNVDLVVNGVKRLLNPRPAARFDRMQT
jgi:GxxExxY protein